MACQKTIEDINTEDLMSSSGTCEVDRTKTLLNRARQEVCGKDVLCREGMNQLHKIVEDITDGRGLSEDIELILELCAAMKEISDCQLSKSVGEHLMHSVQENRDEWDAHIKRKKCKALVCRTMVNYYISGEKCSGCTECMEQCPEKAIQGEKGMIHVIDQEQCTKCGICFEVCSTVCGAVIKAGDIKPQTPDKPIPVGTWQAKGLGLKKGLRQNKA